jgi:hypothetical protein
MTVIDATPHLRLAVHNKNRKKEHQVSRGRNAINRLAHYNELSKVVDMPDAKLRDLVEPYEWYLTELLSKPLRNGLDDLIMSNIEMALVIIARKKKEWSVK